MAHLSNAKVNFHCPYISETESVVKFMSQMPEYCENLVKFQKMWYFFSYNKEKMLAVSKSGQTGIYYIE